jgi:ABC-type uncharacterized transport system involved in gliding motility auxiliary subunit
MSDDSDATSMRHLEKDCSVQIKIYLEPLFELVLRPKKEFESLHSRESHLYKRNSESLSNIVNLANLA